MQGGMYPLARERSFNYRLRRRSGPPRCRGDHLWAEVPRSSPQFRPRNGHSGGPHIRVYSGKFGSNCWPTFSKPLIDLQHVSPASPTTQSHAKTVSCRRQNCLWVPEALPKETLEGPSVAGRPTPAATAKARAQNEQARARSLREGGGEPPVQEARALAPSHARRLVAQIIL
jgi:hypothetical protein